MKFIDAHAHIHDSAFDLDRSDVVERMKKSYVGAITVGTSLEESKKAVELSQGEDFIWATVGQHPTDTKDIFSSKEFFELAKNPRVVGIGECGIDYFRLSAQSKGADEDEKNRQRELFRAQIELALMIKKPLMIHGRPTEGTLDAYEEIFSVLGEFNSKAGEISGNVHFFVGDKSVAKRFMDMNFSFSFGGVITFVSEYDEVVRYIPDNFILSETDCPYVAPAPFRGKRNEPNHVYRVIERLSEIRETTAERMANICLNNTKRVFNIKG